MPGIVAAVFALILAAASPAPSPNDVLYHALARLQSYGSPAYVVYTLDENGTRRRVAFRARDSMMNDSEYPPQTTLPRAHIYHAFVGPLSYTLRAAISTPAPMATPSAPTTDLGETLKTIVATTVHGHLYDVASSGEETIDGRRVERISLRPLRDPTKNALRELWIDEQTYDIRRARYVEPPDFNLFAGQAEVTVDFQTVKNYRIAADWIVIYRSPDLRKPLYRTVRLQKMTFPASLPDWLFDQTQYDAHRRAGDADYLSTVFPSDTT